MNIHLLRDKDLSIDTYRNVLHLLQHVPGPLNFIESEVDIRNLDLIDHIWERKDDFEKQNRRVYSMMDASIVRPSYIFPKEVRRASWEQLFEECINYRNCFSHVSSEDVVVLLTDVPNNQNWFGSVDDSMRNFFIHTDDWKFYFGEAVDIRFPIAYEVIVWVLRGLMFKSRESILNNLHDQAIGCVQDFCLDKKEIILKMRTGDVCPACLDLIAKADINHSYLNQIFEIIEEIRMSLSFRQRIKLFKKPSRLLVKGPTKRLFLKDLGNLEINLNPSERALYLLFLNNPNGIRLPEIIDYRNELLEIYGMTTNLSDQADIINRIDRLTDVSENNVNEVLSRIRGKLKSAVGVELLDFYDIQGARGEAKKILLNRELLSYE
ncbi:MAG: hypothetical protein ACK5FX_11520 [Flavobacteriia bacterium]|jgi:hypothetical protein